MNTLPKWCAVALIVSLSDATCTQAVTICAESFDNAWATPGALSTVINEYPYLTLKVIEFVPVCGRMTVRDIITDAIKALQKILIEKDELGTRIWTVPSPNPPLCWLRGSEWSGTMGNILAGVAAKATAVCTGRVARP